MTFIEVVLNKFADNNKLRETIDSVESGETFQRHLDKLESLDNHYLHEVSQEQGQNSVPRKGQPWLYIQSVD